MKAKNTNRAKMVGERTRLLAAYRMLVHSVREARSLQSVIEKEQQMRRIMAQLRHTAQPQS